MKMKKAIGPIILLMAQYSTKIIGPLVSIYLVRYLGVDDYGLYASAIAVSSFLMILPDFGLQQATLKLSTEKYLSLKRLLRIAFNTSMSFTIIAFLILTVWLITFQYDIKITILAYIISISFFRVAFLNLITTLLQIKRKFVRIAIWSLLINSMQWIVTIICIFLELELYGLIFWPQFISLVFTTIMLVYEGGKIKLFSRIKIKKSEYKEVIQNSLEFGTANSMYQIYHKSDALILSATRNPIEVGFYNVALRITEFVYFFATVLFNQVLFPMLFSWSKNNKERFKVVYKLLNKIILIVGTAAAISVLLFSKELTFIVFGYSEEFTLKILKIMVLAIPFRFLVISIGAILTTNDLVRKRIVIQLRIAIFNVACNAIFIPFYGAFSAVAIMIVTDLLLMVGYLIVVNRNVTKDHFDKKMLYSLPILLMFLVTAYFISDLILSFKIVIVIIIYLLLLTMLLFMIEKKEYSEIKKILR